jgi:hypothetical protein
MTTPIELTVFRNAHGRLSKRISLKADGTLDVEPTCKMFEGSARRVQLGCLEDLAELIEKMPPTEAIALGSIEDGRPDICRVTTISKLPADAPSDLITRSSAFIKYRPGKPAFCLFDADTKGMPAAVAEKVRQAGGFWNVMVSVLPALEDVPHLVRASTTSSLYRTDTSADIPGSDGQHIFISVRDGYDIPRFLKNLHSRLWLEGWGWIMVDSAGGKHDRSPIDTAVGNAERLIFEGAPELVAPLAQHKEARRPVIVLGW